jgi:hypothetical protein
MEHPQQSALAQEAKQELERLLAKGSVHPVLLLPRESGGTEDPRNVTWLPSICLQQKQEFDAVVRTDVQLGRSIQYSAVPVYDPVSISMVPARLSLTAVGPDGTRVCDIDVALHKNW